MAKKQVILCVDDEKNILNALRRTLQSKEYKVLTARSAQEGLEVLENEYVDVVISDQRMPGMTGFEFLRLVKERYPHIIRFMLSGYKDFDVLVRAINEDEIYRFVSKPWDNQELRNNVNLAIEQKRILQFVESIVGKLRNLDEFADKIKIETSRDHRLISLKVLEHGQIFSEELIFKFLSVVLESLGLQKEESLKAVSGAITKSKGAVNISIDIGKGVTLEIELPWKETTP